MKKWMHVGMILVMIMMLTGGNPVYAEGLMPEKEVEISNETENNGLQIGMPEEKQIMQEMLSSQDTVKDRINNYVSGLNGSFSTSYAGKATGCAAFCNYVWKNVFGFDWYTQGKHTKINKDWSSTDALVSFLNANARPGDSIWGKGGHNMILMGWSSSGLTISDGTSGGKVWHNNGFVSFTGNEWKNYS